MLFTRIAVCLPVFETCGIVVRCMYCRMLCASFTECSHEISRDLMHISNEQFNLQVKYRYVFIVFSTNEINYHQRSINK